MIHTIRSAVLFLSVLFVASQANAIALTMGGANGQDVNPGSQVSVTVALDTETTVGITVMSIGVLFDDTRLSYNQAASVTTSFILYDSLQKGGGNYMNASSTCGGGNGSPTAGFGCSLRLNTTNQVNIDYANRDLTNGTSSGPFSGNVGVAQLVTLVFDVLANPGADYGPARGPWPCGSERCGAPPVTGSPRDLT